MRDIDALFTAGNKAQSEKLVENGHKDSWDSMSFNEIFKLIDEEYAEIIDEMGADEIDYKLLRLECADLANACHFMIGLCDKELGK